MIRNRRQSVPGFLPRLLLFFPAGSFQMSRSNEFRLSLALWPTCFRLIESHRRSCIVLCPPAPQLIGIVMDIFTDVDIFKDLLDAGFKRKVAVYIIIEQASIQDFLQMCDRAGMHGGHLKVSSTHTHTPSQTALCKLH